MRNRLTVSLFALCATVSVSGCGPMESGDGGGVDARADQSSPRDGTTPPADTTAPADDATAPMGDSGGTVPADDASVPAMDASAPPTDSGTTPPRDSATPPRDAATPPMDAIAPPRDSGTPPVDSSVAPRDSGTPAACPAPPAGASAQAIAAYDRGNAVRRAMGLECQTMVTTINTAAQNHCNYYTANRAISMCVANAHAEVMSCAMFTGASFSTRMRAAGYTGSASFEVMAFLNNGANATQMWIDSIWHRTPVLSPWTLDMGYGGSAGCDTIDYGVGRGSSVPRTVVATYPYANQTGVPTSFSGNEGPPPPAPPTGWPSGYPIHVYFQGTFATHTLTVDGSSANIEHTWLAPGDARAMGLLRTEAVLYAHRPLMANTRYRVRVTGTSTGGAAQTVDFVFTTGAR